MLGQVAAAEMMLLDVPCWMVKAFAEFHEQQPSILEAYALLIVKGVFRFIREHFGRRRKYCPRFSYLDLISC